MEINKHTTIDQIQNTIKSLLDHYYHEKLADINNSKLDKGTVDRVMKWDGYLDKQGRRDGKLNNLLK